MKHTIEQIIRDRLHCGAGISISMSKLVRLCGGRWSANQRLNKMIRCGHIGLILKEMVTTSHMQITLIRRSPLWCPRCKHYTHISVNPDRTLQCESKKGAGGSKCDHHFGLKLSKNKKLLKA